MRVIDLKINNFRNLVAQRVEFSANTNLLIGDNAQGKTNLIEAILVAVNGQSFRFGHKQDYIGPLARTSEISSSVSNGTITLDLNCKISEAKIGHFSGDKPVSASILRDKIPLVVFSPDSLDTIKDGPEYRRSLIDSVVSHTNPQGPQLFLDFHRSLKARNKLLKENLLGKFSSNQFVDLIESINEVFFQLSARVTKNRLMILEKIMPQVSVNFNQIMQGDFETAVEYQVSKEKILLSVSQEEILLGLIRRYNELRSIEIKLGSTLVGPHKHEIVLLTKQKDSRYFSSQGQQRILILSLKLAEADAIFKITNRNPVLIFDDVLSELDSKRQKAFLAFLEKTKHQKFLTSTDISLPLSLTNKDLLVFNVTNGRLH